MVKLKLDITSLEQNYFENSTLYAIYGGIHPQKLCWYLNNVLEFNLARHLEHDILLNFKVQPQKNTDIFTPITVEERMHHQYVFPVYYYKFPNVESFIWLYGNKSSGKLLIPELKEADILLLLQHTQYLEYLNNVNDYLMLLDEVNLVRKIDLDVLKFKSNLII